MRSHVNQYYSSFEPLENKKSPQKPQCHKCIFHRGIPGNTHIKCIHPLNDSIWKHPLAEIIEICGGIDQFIFHKDLGITANEHGVLSGWFSYPFNFDPIWLITCNGYKEEEKS